MYYFDVYDCNLVYYKSKMQARKEMFTSIDINRLLFLCVCVCVCWCAHCRWISHKLEPFNLKSLFVVLRFVFISSKVAKIIQVTSFIVVLVSLLHFPLYFSNHFYCSTSRCTFTIVPRLFSSLFFSLFLFFCVLNCCYCWFCCCPMARSCCSFIYLFFCSVDSLLSALHTH